ERGVERVDDIGESIRPGIDCDAIVAGAATVGSRQKGSFVVKSVDVRRGETVPPDWTMILRSRGRFGSRAIRDLFRRARRPEREGLTCPGFVRRWFDLAMKRHHLL